jgi:choline dehydrogenase-like flavoprotein
MPGYPETAPMSENNRETQTEAAGVFSGRQRRTLEALCRTLTPGEKSAELAEALTSLLQEAAGQAEIVRVRRALALFDSRLANLCLSGQFRRLADLDEPGRQRVLRAWSASRLPLLRAGFQAFKRLALFLCYALPDPSSGCNPHWAEIGYPGPPPLSPLPAEEEPEPAPLEVTADRVLDADVVVVGSGAGGGVAAGELAAAGWRVVVLEKGGPFREAELGGAEMDSMRRLFEKRGLLTTSDGGVLVLAGSTVGGGTTVNWMTSLRTPDSVLREWEREYGITGATGPEWQASLDAVCARLNVGTAESIPNGQNARLIAGCEALGRRWRVLPRNARGCRDCGFCCFGCPHGAKQGTARTYLRDAQTHGAILVANCHVDRVIVRNGEAAGVEARVNGHRLTVRSRVVVAAGGSVQTPALLLRSGLHNRHIGRHLHLHPVAAVCGLYDEPIEGWRGAMQTAACDHFADLDGGYGFVVEVPPIHPGLVALGLPWRDAVGHRRLMEQLSRLAVFIAITRDRDGGRVRLDSDGRPILDYAISARDAPHVIRAAQEAVRLHAAAGAHTICGPCNSLPEIASRRADDLEAHIHRFASLGVRKHDLTLFSAHQMSSCRMGKGPRQAPVKPDGETWEVRNLFVADASALPTATGVNPMISIMALAHRNAQIIKSRL